MSYFFVWELWEERRVFRKYPYVAQEKKNMNRPILIFKKQKTCTVFLLSYRNTSGSFGKREMMWEHELQGSISTAFLSSPKLLQVFL